MKLSIIENEGNVDDLRVLSQNMQSYIQSENDEMLSTVVDKLNERKGLYRKIFPTEFQKEHDKLTLQSMKQLYANKQRYMNLCVDIQIEVAKKQGDALIAAVGIKNTAMLTSYAQEKIEEMSQTFQEKRMSFAQSMIQQNRDAEQFKEVDYLYDEYKKSLKNETTTFFRSIDSLLDGFISALESKVKER